MNNTTFTTTKKNSTKPQFIGGPELNQRAAEGIAGWAQGEAMALLHQANTRLMEAEQHIAAQEKKIKELEGLAATDALTGLMNRRGFEEFFAQELERTRRHNTFGSVMLLIDLDKFKLINDTHGHLAGDECLKAVGECIKKHIRSVDSAARLGGDEFAVLLSHTDPEKAANCVHQIKQALNSLTVAWSDQWGPMQLKIGASVGIKHVFDTSSFETAYHGADKALYNDKKARKEAAAPAASSTKG